MSVQNPAVSWTTDGPVLHIMLNRPPANALGPVIVDGLHSALDEADASAPKVLILSSELPGLFAAGADIKHMTTVDAASFRAYGDTLRSGLDRLAAHPRCPSPRSRDSRWAAVWSLRWPARFGWRVRKQNSACPRSNSD